MDLVKTKSPAAFGGCTGRWLEIKRGALLSVNKITYPAPQVKSQMGGGYENLS